MRLSDLTVAIDARLACGQNTGDSTYWTGLLYGLSRIAPDARFLLFSNAEKPAAIPWHSSFEWVRVPGRRSRWWSIVRFPMAARRLGASVLHTQYTLSPLAVNGVTTIHDVSFLIGPEWFRSRDRMSMSATVPPSCARAKRVIAVSETCKQEIERLIPAARGKTEVTFNACPPWIVAKPRAESIKAVRKNYGIDGPFALTVGTRWPRKNMALALDAVRSLPPDVDLRLVVTGKPGWGEERLGERGIATGYVSNDEISTLYSAASLYLAPSRHEGFGIPILEAMRCGCPVMCSTGGALPEVAGDAAFVEASWEPEAWASSIARLVQDSSILRELQRKGKERESEFSWERTAKRTLEIYREAVR
jgi:glycosyltransferase involved in cell wall biosynthesis